MRRPAKASGAPASECEHYHEHAASRADRPDASRRTSSSVHGRPSMAARWTDGGHLRDSDLRSSLRRFAVREPCGVSGVLRAERATDQRASHALLQHVRWRVGARRSVSRQSGCLLPLVFSEVGLGAGGRRSPRIALPLLLGMRTELAACDRMLGPTACGACRVHGLPGSTRGARRRAACGAPAPRASCCAGFGRPPQTVRCSNSHCGDGAPGDSAHGIFDAVEPGAR